MTLRKAFYPRDNINRLCVSRNKEGRRLARIKDCVVALIRRLHKKQPRKTNHIDLKHRKHQKINKTTIIIIMSRYENGYSWPSLATPPYRSLLLTSPQGYIQYRHRAVVCRFQLDVFPLLVHVHEYVFPLLVHVHEYISYEIQQCPAYLVRLILIVFMTSGSWPYSCCFVGCCLQDLFNIAQYAVKFFLHTFS